ncbi:hypothetical protein Snoj_40380 [Streptomyces nojiriensis]|uniref:Uncharacterized protein n=1 Tax=Streptomyces nojiriensis TaxID=66374 RepID=A0ABQ3SPQ8_9ACTN|nr:hypothetical protein GCM10010205_09030 [Streptomyces nojiriensis]GHI70120.1 hypothetical protein Snoj_40380 [Streptomyces nojiriensis]
MRKEPVKGCCQDRPPGTDWWGDGAGRRTGGTRLMGGDLNTVRSGTRSHRGGTGLCDRVSVTRRTTHEPSGSPVWGHRGRTARVFLSSSRTQGALRRGRAGRFGVR